MKEASPARNPMARVMSLLDFRLLFAGSATSLLGDQFALIATPWLVLRLTSDPLALGFVLALQGIPRAVFMLVGGAVTDRISPRVIMMVSDVIRLVLTGLMAFVVFTGTVQTWMLYVFSLCFGLVAGFAIPASSIIVPMLVEEQDLQAGNSLIMGSAQLVGFVGPTIAGILIGQYSDSYFGIGLAFALDAVSFAVSAICLWFIHIRQRPATAANAADDIWSSIKSGVQFVWNDKPLRMVFLVILALNSLLVGPLLVGVPVLANQRLPEGAVAFGLLMSAYAGGNLVGYLGAGALPHPTRAIMEAILVGLMVAFGLVIGSLGFIRHTWIDFSLLLLLGLGNGYAGLILFTWMQLRAPREMLGRMMSLYMFANIGLVPVSQAISGAVSKWDVSVLFAGAGSLVLVVTVWMALQPELKMVSESLAAKPMSELPAA